MRTISVILSNNLYDQLKHLVPSRKVSKFVATAIEEKLYDKTESLYKAYAEAYKDKEREKEAKLWGRIDGEGWQ